jgi:hypothetical protein
MTTRRGATATRSETKKAWQLVELHGCWWAYEGELPQPEAFQSHRRQPNRQFLGRMFLVQSRTRCCTATCLVATPKSVPAPIPLMSSGGCDDECPEHFRLPESGSEPPPPPPPPS